MDCYYSCACHLIDCEKINNLCLIFQVEMLEEHVQNSCKLITLHINMHVFMCRYNIIIHKIHLYVAPLI